MAVDTAPAPVPSPHSERSMVLFAEIAHAAHALDEIMVDLIDDGGGSSLVAVQAVIQRIGAIADAGSIAAGRRAGVRHPNEWHYSGPVLEAMNELGGQVRASHG